MNINSENLTFKSLIKTENRISQYNFAMKLTVLSFTSITLLNYMTQCSTTCTHSVNSPPPSWIGGRGGGVSTLPSNPVIACFSFNSF